MTVFTFGRSVTLTTRTKSGVDGDGNDVYSQVTSTVDGCVIWPRQSAERLDGRDTVIVGMSLWAPPGTVIDPLARIVLDDGLVYEVDGMPGTFGPSPFTGTVAGVLVALKRVTG